MRFVINTPADGRLRMTNTHPDVTMSHDGLWIVYRGLPRSEAALAHLYLRSVDQLDATPLRGTEGGSSPFFSSYGEWLGYFVNGTLKKVSVLGGPPLTIADVGGAQLRGVSWGPDDSIVFATNSSAGLLRFPAAGGEPEVVTMVDLGANSHFAVAADGKRFLMTKETPTSDDPSVPAPQITVILNWAGELNRLVPTGKLN